MDGLIPSGIFWDSLIPSENSRDDMIPSMIAGIGNEDVFILTRVENVGLIKITCLEKSPLPRIANGVGVNDYIMGSKSMMFLAPVKHTLSLYLTFLILLY